MRNELTASRQKTNRSFAQGKSDEGWMATQREINGACSREQKASEKNKQAARASLRSGHQATMHILSKSSREPIDRDLEWRCRSQASVASHALIPTETPMCPLCSGLQITVADRWVFWLRSTKREMDCLCAKHTHPSTAELTARPISPKDRVKSGLRSCWRGLSRDGCGGGERQKNGTDPDAG